MSIFSERLKELRIKNQYTQDYLALQMHVGRSTYTHWENGNVCPDIDKIIWLCDFYNVSADYILGRTNTFAIKSNNIENAPMYNWNEDEKITNYYNRLDEENQDYIRGEMVKLYREQEDDSIKNNNKKQIG